MWTRCGGAWRAAPAIGIRPTLWSMLRQSIWSTPAITPVAPAVDCVGQERLSDYTCQAIIDDNPEKLTLEILRLFLLFFSTY